VIPGIVLDGRYRLEELLGRGATAEVYRAIDELLGRAVAVKVFHRGIGDATSVARQRTEMQVLAKLHHPHLVTVYDAKLGVDTGDGSAAADDADLTYLVMELVQGGTLANRITPTGMPPADVARVGAAVAGALAAVHAYGLVHRDIKPANILISTTGDVKLSDFGIARELEAERLTAAADVIGTAAYLSPEQARGAEVGPPTDVYALGLVLLECLTGRREYPGKAVESAVAR
jgi:serine/threonine protein kinase